MNERTSNTPIKLHVGCGKRFLPGFFHIDALSYPHIDRVGPVDKLDFLPDNSVALLYACHVLEHFGRKEVEGVLREWRRVVQPGGILRLAVPDYSVWAHLYVAGKLPNGVEHIAGPMVGGQRDQWDFHKMIFDERSLTGLLNKVGFETVRRWDWRKTEYADYDDYSQSYFPSMDKEHGTLVSLNIEAIK